MASSTPPSLSPRAPLPSLLSLHIADPAIICVCLPGTPRLAKDLAFLGDTQEHGVSWAHLPCTPDHAPGSVALVTQPSAAALTGFLGPNPPLKMLVKLKNFTTKFVCDGGCEHSERKLENYFTCKRCLAWQHEGCMLYGEKGDCGGPVCNHCYMDFLIHYDEVRKWQRRRLLEAIQEASMFLTDATTSHEVWRRAWLQRFIRRFISTNQGLFVKFVVERRIRRLLSGYHPRITARATRINNLPDDSDDDIVQAMRAFEAYEWENSSIRVSRPGTKIATRQARPGSQRKRPRSPLRADGTRRVHRKKQPVTSSFPAGPRVLAPAPAGKKVSMPAFDLQKPSRVLAPAPAGGKVNMPALNVQKRPRGFAPAPAGRKDNIPAAVLKKKKKKKSKPSNPMFVSSGSGTTESATPQPQTPAEEDLPFEPIAKRSHKRKRQAPAPPPEWEEEDADEIESEEEESEEEEPLPRRIKGGKPSTLVGRRAARKSINMAEAMKKPGWPADSDNEDDQDDSEYENSGGLEGRRGGLDMLVDEMDDRVTAMPSLNTGDNVIDPALPSQKQEICCSCNGGPRKTGGSFECSHCGKIQHRICAAPGQYGLRPSCNECLEPTENKNVAAPQAQREVHTELPATATQQLRQLQTGPSATVTPAANPFVTGPQAQRKVQTGLPAATATPATNPFVAGPQAQRKFPTRLPATAAKKPRQVQTGQPATATPAANPFAAGSQAQRKVQTGLPPATATPAVNPLAAEPQTQREVQTGQPATARKRPRRIHTGPPATVTPYANPFAAGPPGQARQAMFNEIHTLSTTVLWHAYQTLLMLNNDTSGMANLHGPPSDWLRECKSRLTDMLVVAGKEKSKAYLETVFTASPRTSESILKALRHLAHNMMLEGPWKGKQEKLGILGEILGLIDKGKDWKDLGLFYLERRG